MIIAIDEVGDFAVTSQRYNYMVAALLTQKDNAFETKRQQFEAWKQTVDKSKYTKYAEVKGTELSCEELLAFAIQVIAAEPYVRSVQIRTVPSGSSIDLVKRYKEIESETFLLAQNHFKNIGDDVGSEFIRKMSNWFKDRNFQHFLKTNMLENCILHSLHDAFLFSQIEAITGDSNSLMKIELKIDGDFIRKKGEKKYFKEALGQAFTRITQNRPFPAIRDLVEAKHPFVELYNIQGNGISMGETFNNRCDFHESHHHFELQIADILGTILHRSQNRKECLDAAAILNKHEKMHKKIHMVLNDETEYVKSRIEFTAG